MMLGKRLLSFKKKKVMKEMLNRATTSPLSADNVEPRMPPMPEGPSTEDSPELSVEASNQE
jgi:hypothetical protein